MELLPGEGKEVMRASAEISGRDGKIAGRADLIEYQCDTETLVKVVLDLSGDPTVLTPGLHAVHIHEKADCSGEFKCAGGHFDPGPAGNTDPDVNHPFHAGDLPNIRIGEDGKGRLTALTTRISLSEGPLSILSGPGTALMVHGNPDPYRGGEHGSGISGGPRIACGIIKKS